MNTTVVLQLPRELKIGSALPLGWLEGATKRCFPHCCLCLSPAALSPGPSVPLAGRRARRWAGLRQAGSYLVGASQPISHVPCCHFPRAGGFHGGSHPNPGGDGLCESGACSALWHSGTLDVFTRSGRPGAARLALAWGSSYAQNPWEAQ